MCIVAARENNCKAAHPGHLPWYPDWMRKVVLYLVAPVPEGNAPLGRRGAPLRGSVGHLFGTLYGILQGYQVGEQSMS